MRELTQMEMNEVSGGGIRQLAETIIDWVVRIELVNELGQWVWREVWVPIEKAAAEKREEPVVDTSGQSYSFY